MTAYKFDHNGKSYSVPSFADIPMGAIRKSRKAVDDADKTFMIIETIMGEDSEELAAIDSMNSEQFAAWLQGWTQGAPLGESSSSES